MAPVLQAMMLTADRLKLELQPFEARTPSDFQSVFSKIIETRPDAIAVTDDAVFIANAVTSDETPLGGPSVMLVQDQPRC